MMKNIFILFISILLSLIFIDCGKGKKELKRSVVLIPQNENNGEIKLITLDPGHFHAALIQKTRYKMVNPFVHVYAPEGEELDNHLRKIQEYNDRPNDPTFWIERVYTGSDYLEKMIADQSGNVVIISGNNRRKTDYIIKSVEAGLNVLSDKPMVISAKKFKLLEKAFSTAAQKKVLLYDTMTERYEITTTLQRELSQISDLFGILQSGTPQKPAVEEVSVHYFYKNVSGSPLIRPPWFFDVKQQGEGIADVTTHLVDLVQWGCFPEQKIDKSDIELLSAKRWATAINSDEFKTVTGKIGFPDYLSGNIRNGKLKVFSNGEINYKIKGVYARVSVEWKFKAPPGSADSHYSVMRGTKCCLEIRQGEAEKYVSTLYVIANNETNISEMAIYLEKALQISPYKGLSLEAKSRGIWIVNIPDKYKVGHEAHFGQVTEKFLEYVRLGKMPEWEVPNMIAKYYTTIKALEMSHQLNRP